MYNGGENEYAAAAKQIEEMTGEKTTADDVKKAIEELEQTSGEKMTPEEFVAYTRELNERWYDPDIADNEWPFKDLPRWPNEKKGWFWNDQHGENRVDVFVIGDEKYMDQWLEELRAIGFDGEFDAEEEVLDYRKDDYHISLITEYVGQNEYHIVVTKGAAQ